MKKIVLFALIVLLLTALTACEFDFPSNDIVMPHGCNEYQNGDWSVEELVEHFEKLGFDDIEVTSVLESFGESGDSVYSVSIEDLSADSWSTEYKSFDKGEVFASWLKIKIETITCIPTLTIDNCSDFAKFVDDSTPSDEEKESFLEAHSGEYLEYDGTIKDWYDDLHWIGISFSVSIEDNEQASFTWGSTSFNDLKLSGKYSASSYSSGTIQEGMKVHMIVKVTSSGKLEICKMQIIG